MRWDTRPHDWHRIWPEKIGAPGAPQVPAEAPPPPTTLGPRQPYLAKPCHRSCNTGECAARRKCMRLQRLHPPEVEA